MLKAEMDEHLGYKKHDPGGKIYFAILHFASLRLAFLMTDHYFARSEHLPAGVQRVNIDTAR
jgi:hypothetical protein